MLCCIEHAAGKPPPVGQAPAISWPVTSARLLYASTAVYIPVVMTTGLNVQFQRIKVCWQLERVSIGRRDEVQTYHECSEAGISQFLCFSG